MVERAAVSSAAVAEEEADERLDDTDIKELSTDDAEDS